MGRWGMEGVAVRDFVGRGGGRREGRVGREDPRLPHTSLDKPGIIVLLARVSSGANGRLSSLPRLQGGRVCFGRCKKIAPNGRNIAESVVSPCGRFRRAWFNKKLPDL